MASVQYLTDCEFSEEVLKYKKAFVQANNIDASHKIITDQNFRYEYMTKILYPQMTVKLFEYLSLMKNVKCSKDGILDIAKYLIEQCMRSQDVLELSQAPIEIFLQAAKEFDPVATTQILKFLDFKDVHAPLDVNEIKKKNNDNIQQNFKRIDIAIPENIV